VHLLSAMDVVDRMSADAAGMSKYGHASVNVLNLHRQLQSTDLRLSAAESSLQELRNSQNIWTTIIQDGLADLSVQVKVASQGPRSMTPARLSIETGEDSKILNRLLEVVNRLFEVEQQMRVTQAMVKATPELAARIDKAERLLQELEAKVQHDKDLQEQPDNHNKLKGRSDMGSEIFSRDSANASISRIANYHRIPLMSQPQQSMRNNLMSRADFCDAADAPKSGASDFLTKTPQHLPFLHSHRVQQLSEGRSPPLQVQTQQNQQRLCVAVSPIQQYRQLLTNHDQQRRPYSMELMNFDCLATRGARSVPHTTRQTSPSLSPKQPSPKPSPILCFRQISIGDSQGQSSVQPPGM